jgi:hypothetical protein
MKFRFSLLAVLSCVALLPAAEPPATDGLYVTVGYGARRMSSRDGVTWDNETEWVENGGDDDYCLFGVAFGKGRFVAVGGATKIGHILITQDGKKWRHGEEQKSRVATIAFGNDRFVAGMGRNFLYSTDGEKWAEGGKIDYDKGLYFRKSAFGNGVFVMGGDCDVGEGKPRQGWLASTTDGEKTASFESGFPNIHGVAFGGGRFVVVGDDGFRASSADGKKWEYQQREPGEAFWSVAWDGERFLASGGKFLYTSADGKTWHKEAKGIPCNILLAGKGSYIGASWGGNIWHSADGLNWKKGALAPGNSFEAAAFGAR